MKKDIHTITQEQARLLALQSQGLLSPTNKKKGTNAALYTIEQLGYVQIDTLAVVARAHHHTLWTRLPDYKESFLVELLEAKSIFEYWSHAASYLPMSDFKFSLPRKRAYEQGKSHWFEQDKKMNKLVLDRIKAEGPLQSKDFEHKRNGPGNWYEWKPAKRALEQLFMEGKLMVAKRQGFQKLYDLTENVLPITVDTSYPTESEMAEHLIKRAIQAQGLVSEAETHYLRTSHKPAINKLIKQLIQTKELQEISIESIEKPYYTTTKTLNSLVKISHPKNMIQLLSPFDNAVIQRKRLQHIFDFDYMIECYLPESKRKFGYFTLPVLFETNFVARMDPKADRANQTFYIKSMHFEKGFKPNDAFNHSFGERIKAFAAFNGCSNIIIETADKSWKRNIQSILKANG